jgi:hypothetical protein
MAKQYGPPKTYTYQDQLDYLWDLRERARRGIVTEKIKGAEVVPLTEAHPMVELQVTRLMVEILEIIDGGNSEPIALDIRITEAVDIP